MLPGESARDCAVREVLEETGLSVRNPEQVGTIHFYKYARREIPDWTVRVFSSRRFDGVPVAGRGGVIEWFIVNSSLWRDVGG